MKILVVVLAPLWSPHFETDLDVIARHESAGDDVVVVSCDGELRSCVANPYNRKIDCMACRSKSKKGYLAIGRKPETVELVSRPHGRLGRNQDAVSTTPASEQFDSVAELSRFEYRGLPIGRGAASSLISTLRESAPDMKSNALLVNRLVDSGIQMTDLSIDAIQRHRPDLVYVFNGRFATAMPVVAACEMLGVPYRTHDAAYRPGKYRMIDSGTVHDIRILKSEITALWESAALDGAGRAATASRFFVDRRFGGEGAGPTHLNFGERMQRGRIPDAAGSAYVLILNSSEDEFVALTQYKNPVYRNQMTALEAIVDDPRLTAVRFVLRVHPNLAGLNNEQTRHLEELSSRNNLVVIPADQREDTYSLMDRAEVVISFGSTAGLEAVFWGRPSILVGRAPFEDLGLSRATNHEEVVNLVLNPPAAAPRDAALPYGYFMLRSGEDFEAYQQSSYFVGSVKGITIRPSWGLRRLRQLRNFGRLVWDGAKSRDFGDLLSRARR